MTARGPIDFGHVRRVRELVGELRRILETTDDHHATRAEAMLAGDLVAPDMGGQPMPTEWITVRIPIPLAERADKIAEALTETTGGIARASRGSVITEAVTRGLEALEAEWTSADQIAEAGKQVKRGA